MKIKILFAFRYLFSMMPEFKGKYKLMSLVGNLFDSEKEFLLTDYHGDIFINVSLKSHIERNVFWLGAYHKVITDLINKLVKNDFVCLDIGANVGVYSLIMAKRSFNGEVLCFEPHPVVRKKLLMNIDANRFNNVKVFPWAVGEKDGFSKLYVSDDAADNQGQSSLIRQDHLNSSIQIETRRIDCVKEISDLERLDFIKVDVEGFEVEVITSMMKLIEKHKPLILFEYTKSAWEKDLNDFLIDLKKGLMYEFYIVEDGMTRVDSEVNLDYEYCNVLCVANRL